MKVNSSDSGNATAGIKLIASPGGFAVLGDSSNTAGSGGTIQGAATGIFLQNDPPPLPVLFRYAAEAALADGWGDPAAWLVEAQEWFAQHGLDRPETACRRMLRAAGIPVGRSGGAEIKVAPVLRRLGVTAREGEVLTLLGDRLTNRAIGERLFLSHRTVEKHVASLRRKLAASSRDDIPAAARRLANG